MSIYRLGFIAPNVHTNMLPWIQGLQGLGCSVAMLVSQQSVELGEDIDPLVSVALPRLFVHFGVGKGAVSLLEHPFKRLKLFVRSVRQTVKWCRQVRVAVAIVRVTPRYNYIGVILGCLIAGVKPIFYTQSPVMFRSSRTLRSKALAMMSRASGAPVMTPSLFRYNEIYSSGKWKTDGKHYIPFAARTPEGAAISRSGGLAIIMVADYKPRKMIVEALEAIREAVILENLRNVSVIVVGSANEKHYGYVDEVNRTMHELESSGINGECIFNATFAQTQMLLRRADMFILASRSEPASVAQLEAMAQGCAVVVGADNGTAHYVVRGESGIHLFGEASSWVPRLRGVLSDPNLIARMGRAGSHRARVHHDPQQIAKALLRLAIHIRFHRQTI